MGEEALRRLWPRIVTYPTLSPQFAVNLSDDRCPRARIEERHRSQVRRPTIAGTRKVGATRDQCCARGLRRDIGSLRWHRVANREDLGKYLTAMNDGVPRAAKDPRCGADHNKQPDRAPSLHVIRAHNPGTHNASSVPKTLTGTMRFVGRLNFRVICGTFVHNFRGHRHLSRRDLSRPNVGFDRHSSHRRFRTLRRTRRQSDWNCYRLE